MKIFMLCEFYNENLEYQENLLVKYYRKHGHEVTVVTSTFESIFDYYNDKHDNSVPEKTYYDHGAKIIKLPYRYNLLNRLRAYKKLDQILKEEKPDLIYLHCIMLNLLECIDYLKRNPGCKMIMDYHADYSNSGKNFLSLKILHGVIRKYFLDRALPYLSKIFPIVPAGAKFLHEVYAVPYDKMDLLPLGADTDLGSAVREAGARRKLREKYQIGDDKIVIVSGGKLDPLKRTEELIDAVCKINNPNIYLIILGQASGVHAAYGAMLEEKASQNKNIKFVGWQNSVGVYEHFDMADFAVFPASQSILWQQAISMNLPLVVGEWSSFTNSRQEVSYLNEEGNILIINPQKNMQDELIEKINYLALNDGVRSDMREAAGRVTNKMLNWNNLINKTLAFN
ncbi:glycosyltransferase family 4 protein [Undibacterium sp. WLX3042]|uniref:glycosyltransferase family 4 protein n=1 Tax=Undibacterium sp. WLX3042 TaxID=3412686 RepID=UPI003C2D04D1